jgi:hypothetical protein
LPSWRQPAPERPAAVEPFTTSVPTPEVRFYVAPPKVRSGYVFDKSPGVVFVRHAMGLSETRSTIAQEVAHLAGGIDREARRDEASRRRGTWWATRRQPAEMTAEEWAIQAAELRGRRYGLVPAAL